MSDKSYKSGRARVYKASPEGDVSSYGLVRALEINEFQGKERANVLHLDRTGQVKCVYHELFDHCDILQDLEQQVGGDAAVLWAYVCVGRRHFALWM